MCPKPVVCGHDITSLDKEWAVFQSTSEHRIKRTKVLFEVDNNGGPTITSFYNKEPDKNGNFISEWQYYTMPRYP